VPSGRQVCHRPSGGEHAALVADLDRAAQVRRNDAGVRPSSVGAPSGPKTTRLMPASQGSQRARAAEIIAPKPGVRGGRVRADLRPERRLPVGRTP
jgi:hypothetical protein